MKFSITISPEAKGTRLDQIVAAHVSHCSRSQASSLIAKGGVLVGGERKRPAYKVRPGDVVAGRIPEDDQQPLPKARSIDLDIIHEDSRILVVNKPPGLVVHPAPGHTGDTLVNGLLAYDGAFGGAGWEDPQRPGIVHRLDMDTSGLIVVAKRPGALRFLQKEFKQRRVGKHYLALAEGDGIPDEGVIELPIGRHPTKRKRMSVSPETGKPARTGFRVLERFTRGALVDVKLYTGRTHQIRVHFYHQGFPLFGDRVYQMRRNRKGKALAPRQMLHSWRLSFRHPYSGKRVSFEAPMPDDFKQFLGSFSS